MEIEIYGRPYDVAYREVLSRLAAGKQVRFIEDADDDQILHAYQSARAVVLPSVQRTRYGSSSAKAELLGLVPLEAMSCATPVVCSDIGPLGEIVLDGQTGYVFPAGDASALRERLRKLLLDEDRWTRMSRAALERACGRFSWTAVAKQTLEAYALDRAG
jgi:glycogen(starch) synthase